MSFEIVTENAEQKLLAFAEQAKQQRALRGVIFFRSSVLRHRPQDGALLQLAKPILKEKQTVIYMFHDGDFAVAWNPIQQATVEELCKAIYSYLDLTGNENLHTLYDFNGQFDDIEAILKEKIKHLPTNKQKYDSAFKLAFTESQRNHLKRLGRDRLKNKMPSILIVEDQEFSRKLLTSMLNRTYVCHSAATAKEALTLYVEHIPCICFLDIELPDLNGHELAAFIRANDPDSYVVMVSSNHYEKDVVQAAQNRVQGFVIKPYSKQKILECIDKYLHARQINS